MRDGRIRIPAVVRSSVGTDPPKPTADNPEPNTIRLPDASRHVTFAKAKLTVACQNVRSLAGIVNVAEVLLPTGVL